MSRRAIFNMLRDGEEITLAVDFHPTAMNGCKFHIESRKEMDGGWEITGWWTEIDLAGRLLGLRLNVPTTLTIMVERENE